MVPPTSLPIHHPQSLRHSTLTQPILLNEYRQTNQSLVTFNFKNMLTWLFFVLSIFQKQNSECHSTSSYITAK